MKDYTISFFYDKRYKNKQGKCNVRLSVYNKNITEASKRRKVYSTPFWFSDEEWLEIESFQEQTSGKKTKAYTEIENRILPIKKKLEDYLESATEKADSLIVFSFDAFERLQNRTTNNKSTLIADFYKSAIDDYIKNDQVGTASSYDSSLKSLTDFRFVNNYSGDFTFIEVTPGLLNQYEKWMKKNDKSNATIGIYLRPLRALFNSAIYAGVIHAKQYPFHSRENKDGYKIPASKKVKKALSADELKILFNAENLTPEQEKAKDFFFFSFLSNGMNVKDISLLKWSDVDNNEFSFIRAKTAHTTKDNQTPIVVTILDFHREIFAKYGSPQIKSNYIFNVVDKKMSADQQKKSINAFTRFINQHLKNIAIKNKITSDISTYWARHSFASQLMNDNTSPEFIKQALGHSSLLTTNNYLSGFSSNIKEEKAKNLFEKLK